MIIRTPKTFFPAVPLSQNLVKFRSREIRVCTFAIALKFDMHYGISAADLPVKSERYDCYNTQSWSSFDTRDLTMRRLAA